MLEDGSFLEQFLTFPVWDGNGFCYLQLNPNSISLGAIQVSLVQTAPLSLQNVALVCLGFSSVLVMFSFCEYCSLLPIPF